MTLVKKGSVTLNYEIYEYEQGISYDRVLSNGAESDTLFSSVEEAEADVRRRYS